MTGAARPPATEAIATVVGHRLRYGGRRVRARSEPSIGDVARWLTNPPAAAPCDRVVELRRDELHLGQWRSWTEARLAKVAR